MIVDARSLPQNTIVETDVCIIGAGIAGIALARELKGTEFRVCLLESGGIEPDKTSQAFLWGENVGHPYYPLDIARSCGFGGTSNRWTADMGDNGIGVRLRPLDEIDFEERDWVPFSGWPFTKAHLDPFYARAQAMCKTGSFDYNVSHWEQSDKQSRLRFKNDRVITAIFQFASRNVFIKDYRDEITQADNITTYVYANVTEIETNKTAGAVSRVHVASSANQRFIVAAKVFILAGGAIETPRLLLLSNKTMRQGLGNQNDLVGRFFMEHPHIWSGKILSVSPKIISTTDLYRVHKVNGVPIMGKLAIAEEVLRQEKMLNYCVSIHPYESHRRAISPSWRVVSWPLISSQARKNVPDRFANQEKIANAENRIDILQGGRRKIKRTFGRILNRIGIPHERVVFLLNHMTEQAPNPESRVTLADELDSLGRNRVRLNWQLGPIDIRSIIRAQEIIDEELRNAGLGRLEIELRDGRIPSNLEGGWHHMGTTRMHLDPKKGVVDSNCRVHGIMNLFIAGPSVFPTSGYANPVLTIMALSVRLADYIKKSMNN